MSEEVSPNLALDQVMGMRVQVWSNSGDNWHTDTSPAWVVEYDSIPLRLTEISFDATGHLALRWHSPLTNFNYTVESSASMADGTWSVVEPANQWPITAQTWTNSALETMGRRFFRVRVSW